MGSEEWREQRVKVRGGELAIQRRGQGRAFFWGHGLTSSSAQEDQAGLRLWEQLREGWEVIRVDARGHGASSVGTGPQDHRWSELAADALALADALGHPRFVIGGASMGAAVALHAAVAAPARVDALVLMIPPTAWATRPAQASRYLASADLAEREGLAALAAAEASQPPIPIFRGLFDPAEMARARYAGRDAKAIASVLRGAAASDFPPPDAVAALRQPALLLAWEGDDGHPLSTAERLAELLPDATLSVARRLQDLGDWPRRVAEFCARQSA
ncbi:MAG TPA: alpha/beta hydrolase [Myxococcota bacterium]|jgi:pimeloyl-ACP methyl ester carboxylesterase